MKFKISKAFLLSIAGVAASAMATQSIPVKSVFFPAQGYDDNDALVQFVVDAELPNSCYIQGLSHAKLDAENKTIEVVQLAERREDGICANSDENLPQNAKLPIPFSSETSLRTLAAGDYSVEFLTQDKKTAKSLHVDVAPSTSVDSYSYATITNIFAPADVSASSDTFEIRITGTLNSSCAYLSKVEAILVNDVIVVLPKVAQKNDICLPTNKSFYKVVKAKTPAPGRYLLHGRSQGSVARNMLFNVTE